MNETTLFTHEETHEPRPEMVRVWDPLVRLFHWSLAVSFLVAFLTEDDLLLGQPLLTLVLATVVVVARDGGDGSCGKCDSGQG